MPVKLSLIIPVYNEPIRLIPGLNTVLAYLIKCPYRWELILVDDGSDRPVTSLLKQAQKDQTLRFKLAKLPVSLYRLSRNQGKGAAIRKGVEQAQGEYLVFTDIDLSVPITTLSLLLKELPRYPVVIASRRLSGSRIAVHQSRAREFLGDIFTKLSNLICATGVSDVTCGFKGFRRVIAKKLFALSRINRWVFDSEILFLAQKNKLKIQELPATWTNQRGSKVRFSDVFTSLFELVKIRWYDWVGAYAKLSL